ncbi:MAG: hypothetical protein K8T91_19310 [Planctomycetes bacterium]|nr:hypothetical protein [Planctomycetota bacterium]
MNVIQNSRWPNLWLAPTLLMLATGCVPEIKKAGVKQSNGSVPAVEQKGDVFAGAVQQADPGEGPYIEAAKPFLNAIADRDYTRVYEEISSHARAKTNPEQFVPPVNDKPPVAGAAPIQKMTPAQCAEWMKKMESQLGVPDAVQHVYVHSIEPEVLAGKGDRIDVMFAIGGMPAEIPADIRKASVRAQIRCQLPDDQVKKIAHDLKISEQQVRAGNWPENDQGYDPDERPYFNLKLVLVEEGGKLKVAYFEFMPPSLFD